MGVTPQAEEWRQVGIPRGAVRNFHLDVAPVRGGASTSPFLRHALNSHLELLASRDRCSEVNGCLWPRLGSAVDYVQLFHRPR